MSNSLVSVEWLHKNINSPLVVILDASHRSIGLKETAKFRNIRIKNARYFDLKNLFSDQNGKYPNTFPSASQFQNECRNLGINDSSQIVVYDNLGIYSSPRVWWMFKAMGHQKVHVLDGGLPEWVKHGYESEDCTISNYRMGNFTARLNNGVIKDFDFISSNISSKKEILIDARSSGRFEGTEPEPREGLKSGHIAGSVNIPYSDVLENGKFKSNESLVGLFESKQVGSNPLIFSCGSGVTACIVLLAAEQIFDNSKSVYDGSWTEWATEKAYLD